MFIFFVLRRHVIVGKTLHSFHILIFCSSWKLVSFCILMFSILLFLIIALIRNHIVQITRSNPFEFEFGVMRATRFFP